MKYKTSKGIELELVIIRKKNKHVYFRFDEDLNLCVTSPIYLSQDSILNMLKENEQKIMEMYDKAYLKSKDKELFLYLGNKYFIEIDESIEEITFKDNKVYTPSKKELDLFYQKMVEKIFREEVEIAKKCFSNLPEFTLKFRYMKTRWGVCNTSKKTITLNTELLKKDITLLDYVIIHEMCHFFEGNHSKNFWHLVSLAYPNYKEARRRLKE